MKSISTRSTFRQKKRFGQCLANCFHVAAAALSKKERKQHETEMRAAARQVPQRGVSRHLWGPTPQVHDPRYLSGAHMQATPSDGSHRSLADAFLAMSVAARAASYGMRDFASSMTRRTDRMPSTVMSESFPAIYSQMSNPVRVPIALDRASAAAMDTRERTSRLRDFIREGAHTYVLRALHGSGGGFGSDSTPVFSEVNVRWSYRNFDELMYSPLRALADALSGPYTVEINARLRSMSARHDAALRSIILYDWSSPQAVRQTDIVCTVGEALGEGVTLFLSDEIGQVSPAALFWLSEMWGMNVEPRSAQFHAAHDPMNFLYFLRPGHELESVLRRVPGRVWSTVSSSIVSTRDRAAAAATPRLVVGVDLSTSADRSGIVVRDRYGNDVMSMGVLGDAVSESTYITADMLRRNTIQPYRAEAPPPPPAPDHPDAGQVLLRPMRTVFGVSVESVREKDGTVSTRKTPDTRK